MTNQLYNTSYTDSNGNKIVFDNNIISVGFYDSTGESWKSSVDSDYSWYSEKQLPSDSFYGTALKSDKWAFYNDIGSVSGTVSNGLTLKAEEAWVRGGITSENLWYLSGDFDVRLYIDETFYYNEYRSNTFAGLTVSVDDSNKLRVSKCFDGSNIGYKAQQVEAKELKYYGWFDNGSINTSVGGDVSTCCRIVRSGNEINTYVSSDSGFVLVGSGVSGSTWSDSVYVSVEVETDQYNTYRARFTGVTVSGSLVTPTVFSSDVRGTDQNFPDKSVLVVDGSGLSIIDDDDMSLWMRFNNVDNGMFRGVNSKISASQGKIYYTTSSGVFCVDFTEDNAKWYTKDAVKETISGIATRNFDCVFESSGQADFLLDNEVTDISSYYDGTNTFLAVATASGVGLLINDSEEKTEGSSEGSASFVDIDQFGTLYWNYYDSTSNTGKLNYRQNVSNLVGVVGSTFSKTDYYDNDTSPFNITAEKVNGIYSFSTNKVLVAHSAGLDFIGGWSDTVFYGPSNVADVFSDPDFDAYVGLNWIKTEQSSAGFGFGDVYRTDSWSSSGTYSLKLSERTTRYVVLGDYTGVYQSVDLTSVDKVYYDFKFLNESSSTTTNSFDFEVLCDGAVLATHSDLYSTFESFDNIVDVSSYTGTCVFMFRIKAKRSGTTVTNKSFFVDNIRTYKISPDYAIIPSSSHEVLEVYGVYTDNEKKAFFVTSKGYGSIDLDTNTLDYFTEIEDVVPSSLVMSADYSEYVDEV